MATYDSTIRLRQLNKPELSGYIVEVIGEIPQTGDLTGFFYPLDSNPNGYVTTGETGTFATQSDLDSNYASILAQVGLQYYSSSNPSGYITSGQTGIFVTTGKTGIFVTTGQTGNFLTDATGIGLGSGIFSGKIGDKLIFRNISAVNGIDISSDLSGLIFSITGIDKLVDLNNIVKTTGNQEINGVKVFLNSISGASINSSYIVCDSLDVSPFSNQIGSRFIANNNNVIITDDELKYGLTFITGTSALQFDLIGPSGYINLVSGIFSGKNIYQNGVKVATLNDIASVTQVNPESVVYLTGNQNISGNKTFLDSVSGNNFNLNSVNTDFLNVSILNSTDGYRFAANNNYVSIQDDGGNYGLYFGTGSPDLFSFVLGGPSGYVDFVSGIFSGNKFYQEGKPLINSGQIKGGSGIKISGNAEDGSLTLILTGFVGAEVISVVDNAVNLTPGTGIFKQLNGNKLLEFKGLTGLSGIQITGNDNTLFFNATGLVLNSETGIFATNEKLILTGDNLQNQLNVIRNDYYPRSNPRNFIDSAVTSLIVSGHKMAGNLILSGAGSVTVKEGECQTIIISGSPVGNNNGGNVSVGENIGNGTEIYDDDSSTPGNLRFRTLKEGNGVTISRTATEITIGALNQIIPGVYIEGGESLGDGIPVYKGKNLANNYLQFRSLKRHPAKDNAISITSSDDEIIFYASNLGGTPFTCSDVSDCINDSSKTAVVGVINSTVTKSFIESLQPTFTPKCSDVDTCLSSSSTLPGIIDNRIDTKFPTLLSQNCSTIKACVGTIPAATTCSDVSGFIKNGCAKDAVTGVVGDYLKNNPIPVKCSDVDPCIQAYITKNPIQAVISCDTVSGCISTGSAGGAVSGLISGMFTGGAGCDLISGCLDKLTGAIFSGLSGTLTGLGCEFVSGCIDGSGGVVYNIVNEYIDEILNDIDITNIQTFITNISTDVDCAAVSGCLNGSIGVNPPPPPPPTAPPPPPPTTPISTPPGSVPPPSINSPPPPLEDNPLSENNLLNNTLEVSPEGNVLINKYVPLTKENVQQIAENYEFLPKTAQFGDFVNNVQIEQDNNNIGLSLAITNVFNNIKDYGGSIAQAVPDGGVTPGFYVPGIRIDPYDFSLGSSGSGEAQVKLFHKIITGFNFIFSHDIYQNGNLVVTNIQDSWESGASIFSGKVSDQLMLKTLTGGFGIQVVDNTGHLMFKVTGDFGQGQGTIPNADKIVYTTGIQNIDDLKRFNNGLTSASIQIGVDNVFEAANDKVVINDPYGSNNILDFYPDVDPDNWTLSINGGGYQNSNIVNFNKISSNIIKTNYIVNEDFQIDLNSNFIGSSAGVNDRGAANSQVNFIGYKAGYDIRGVNTDAILIGTSAGESSENSQSSNFIGRQAGASSVDCYSSNFIGEQAGYYSYNNHKSNFIGYSAGGSTEEELSISNWYSNFVGPEAGLGASDCNSSNFLGYEAGKKASTALDSNFIGLRAGYDSNFTSNSIFIGRDAGYQSSTCSNSIFIGEKAGYKNIYNLNSILIGNNTSGKLNSISIGQGVANSIERQLNIGNILYASNINTGVEPSSTAISSGKVGILVEDPQYTLQVNGDCKIGARINILDLEINGSPTLNISTPGFAESTNHSYQFSLFSVKKIGNKRVFSSAKNLTADDGNQGSDYSIFISWNQNENCDEYILFCTKGLKIYNELVPAFHQVHEDAKSIIIPKNINQIFIANGLLDNNETNAVHYSVGSNPFYLGKFESVKLLNDQVKENLNLTSPKFGSEMSCLIGPDNDSKIILNSSLIQISGDVSFNQRPQVNGTNVMLQGEGGQGNISIFSPSENYSIYSGNTVGTSNHYFRNIKGGTGIDIVYSQNDASLILSVTGITNSTNKDLVNEKNGYGAGIYTLSKTISNNSINDVFGVFNKSGSACQIFDVMINSDYSVAKKYSVVHQQSVNPISYLNVNSGPSGSNDFSVTFYNSGNSGVAMKIGNSGATSKFLITLFLGGSSSGIQIKEY